MSTTKSGSENSSAVSLFRQARLVFWDFDGVIKETIHLKGEAFARLFRDHGEALMTKIRKHHARHGGVSRLDKIPLYLGWAGLAQDSENVGRFCERFAEMVFQKVVEAPWVPGAKELLLLNPFRQRFYLVTATPQKEIEAILAALDLMGVFEGVFGSPVKKDDAIRKALENSSTPNERCLLIGDSLADQQAALATNIPFLLRQHSNNCNWPWDPSLPRILDFLNL